MRTEQSCDYGSVRKTHGLQSSQEDYFILIIMKKYIITSSIALFTFASVVGAQNFTFSNNLSVGASGSDVVNLQTWLISNGYDIPALSSGSASHGYFGAQTKTALMKYQFANGIPNTGYFGPMTRGRMNEWRHNDSRFPVINGIDAPTALSIGETGNWNVRATDPQNGTLSYSVDWGDVMMYAAVACPAGYSCTPIAGMTSAPTIQQGSTFTHSYSDARTYNVKFTVTNSAGLTAQSSATVQVGTSGASPLNVISPNGGEVWQKGTTQVIRWNAPYYFRATYADLKLVPYYQPCTSRICPMGAVQSSGAQTSGVQTSMMYPYRAPYTIATNISINQNSYSWSAGQYISNAGGVTPLPYCASFGPKGECLGQSLVIPDGQYTIQICETGTNNCDSSNSPFTITSPSPTVKVTSPNGGEVWQANSTRAITWNVTGATDVSTKVDLYLDQGAPCPVYVQGGPMFQCPPTYILDRNIPISTIYNWIVATDINNVAIPAGNYTVRVCLAGSTTNCDSSDSFFTITR